jgi:mRNA interferase MazF
MPGLVRRGDVVEVNLDPAVGSEAKKGRPCVVIQNDVGNKYSPVTIVAAITGAENVPKRYPIDVLLRRGQGGLVKDSVVQCSQLRSVDEKRILKTLGHLSPETMQFVDQALRISLAL